MEFKQLQYFQAVAKHSNISRAARELYITQPNLSKSIAQLERELGVPLFEHRKGKIELNEYGRLFLKSVDRCFSELTSGIQAVQQSYETRQSVITVTCNIESLLPDLIKSFSPLHPEISIRQLGYQSGNIAELLLNRAVDFAITSLPIPDERLTFKFLGQKEFILLMCDNHPLAKGDTISLAQMKEERFVCDNSRLNADMLRHICKRSGFEPNIGYEVDEADLIYDLVVSNGVLAFMPTPHYVRLRQRYPDSPIHVAHIADEIPPAKIGVTYHIGYVISREAELFIEFLKQFLVSEENAIKSMEWF